ncbi:MAG: alpha-1,2-fucosyltransferase [Flavobacteriales bacterium]|nr:alpha-1,2-fucosyltransferase [Flavobacteriales bacterium]
MIITRIFQGLGNQLFQYAFGRAMAMRNDTVLKIDKRFFLAPEVTMNGVTYARKFELDRYNLELTEASDFEIAVFKGQEIPKLINRIQWKLSPKLRPKVIKEDLSKFSPELNSLKGNLYLDGYFTSEEFFKDYASTIRKEVTLKSEMNLVNREWAAKIANCNSVCISLRRTDFLANPTHNVCSTDYYLNGLNKVQELLGRDIEVFIWSDDNKWTVENFKPPYPCHYMSHNFPDFHEDLRLMTHCKHHVIPNSTFSWWAAWLGEHEGQIVVAPKRWLNSTDVEYNHVVPDRWHKIEN